MSTTTRVSDSIARPTRTLIQASPALVIVEGIDAFLYDMSDRQYGAAVVLLTLLFSYSQALIENYKGRAFLRDMPPANVPLVDAT